MWRTSSLPIETWLSSLSSYIYISNQACVIRSCVLYVHAGSWLCDGIYIVDQAIQTRRAWRRPVRSASSHEIKAKVVSRPDPLGSLSLRKEHQIDLVKNYFFPLWKWLYCFSWVYISRPASRIEVRGLTIDAHQHQYTWHTYTTFNHHRLTAVNVLISHFNISIKKTNPTIDMSSVVQQSISTACYQGSLVLHNHLDQQLAKMLLRWSFGI